MDGVVRARFLRGEADVSHPSYQAWSYSALLEGFNEAIYNEPIELRPCAYLHNHPPPGGDIVDPFYADHLERAPVFLKGDDQRQRLRDFISKHVRTGDKGQALYRIEGGRIRPSRSLADALAALLKGNREFVLVDDQKLVYERAMREAARARETSTKRVLIVEGGPGTGKSVVAVNLLVGLTEAGMTAKYVTKNAAPRAVYEAKLTGHMRRSRISWLFSGSGGFTDSEPDAFDALIVDEAHRLNEKSGLYANLGENQVKEIISAARLSVFFIDESQRVTLRDIGDKVTIRKWARHFGAEVSEMPLASQFRCNGSDGYLAWLDNTLQVRDTANTRLAPGEFDFRVVDTPTELREMIVAANAERNRARMVAGYCWKWVSKRSPGAHDIVMPEHGFRARWNLSQDGGLWMISPGSISEIGCIHTAQGLEVDYIGVIVGDDFVVRDGKVVTNPSARATTDKSLSGLRNIAKADPARAAGVAAAIIKNTYRTLMTRGMKGCYVYFTDAQTREYFRSSIGHVPEASAAPDAPAENIIPFRRRKRRDVTPYVDAIPVLPLKIAAGAFSPGSTQSLDDVDWATPEDIRIAPGMFLAQVVGESMNKRIPNGAWCVFRAQPTGSRQGKIVLAQHRSIDDPDTGGSYTVKMYSSEKRVEGDGWVHSKIVLSPLSSDPRYLPIELTDEGDFAVVAELVVVLA
ncbi:DNA/RNA helicase domain-containing protein [Ramlibacter sp.]|uniref:DNA/RNA helicase domain-containing protein n=1 Tax=Ramlibacter sp. TaxID=1917967 RepID=UPI003D0BDC36